MCPKRFCCLYFFFEMMDIQLREKYWVTTLLLQFVLYLLFCGKLPFQPSCCFCNVLSWPDIPRSVMWTDPGPWVCLNSHGQSWFHGALPCYWGVGQQGGVLKEVWEAKHHHSRLWAIWLLLWLYTSKITLCKNLGCGIALQ